LDGQTSHGAHSGDFTIIENTTATAVFVPLMATLKVYVKDPTPNSSEVHSGSAGHTFWEFQGTACIPDELQGFANEKWGFYPAGTPYSGSSGSKSWISGAGQLRDDSATSYTNIGTYSITYDEYIAGLAYTKSIYDGTTASPVTVNYHVETFNCTDAAIAAAAAAGESLPSAQGACSHLGHSFSGNCPGVLGENIEP
jgi:hypothetical protein